MEDWQDNFFSTWEATVKKEFDQFCKDVGEWVETVTEEIVETVDFVAEQLDAHIPSEVSEFVTEIFQPIVEIYNDWENLGVDYFNEFHEDFTDPTEFNFNPKVEPSSEVHPACIGCHHYHGRIYNGNLIVCGMHPYGWDDKNCPDWENKNI